MTGNPRERKAVIINGSLCVSAATAATLPVEAVVSPAWVERNGDRVLTGPGARARRDFDIRIVTLTAGIRGTDVWGNGTVERNVVCLIEGNIEVSYRNEKCIMREPLSFFIAGRDARASEVLRYDFNITGLATMDDSARLENLLRASGHMAR